MLYRLRFFICAALLFALTDGHWAVLQSVAWARMIQTYSENSTLAEAVRDTFSGEKPCSMCDQISVAKSNRPTQIPGPTGSQLRVKLDPFSLSANALFPLPRVSVKHYPAFVATLPPARFDTPPSPVPIHFRA